MMTLSKRQYGYLNQREILFRLQYETHSLQMHPELPCSSVVAPAPKLSEWKYALRLVVIPCQYLTSLLQFLQPISPSPSSHISSVAVLHLLHRRIHTCCPAYPPPSSSADVFTTDCFCYPHYPGVTICPHVGSRSLSIFAHSVAGLITNFAISVVPHLICFRSTSPLLSYTSMFSYISSTVLFRRCLHFWPCLTSLPPVSLLRSLSHYLPSFRVLCFCCLPTFSGRVFSSICIVLFYTACYALLCSTIIFSLYDMIFLLHFSFLLWHGSNLSPWCSRSAPICRVFHHLPSLRSASIL